MKLFGRPRAHVANPATVATVANVANVAQLGSTFIAMRCDALVPPPGSTLIVFGADGRARRPAPRPGKAVACREGEIAWCCHAGPYAMELVPFAAAPEAGLRLECVIGAPDPLAPVQRFDLFLFSEADGALALAGFAALVQGAVRGALSQGLLELPPCTSLDEWQAFRGALDEMLYTRFGVTVTDCLPLDLGETIDYAAMLQARMQAQVQPSAPLPAAAPSGVNGVTGAAGPAPDDAAALRRLFLELPVLTARLRMLPLPAGAFAAQRALLQALALAALDVNTMPALELAAPGVPLAAAARQARAVAASAAAAALDDAWNVLARMKQDGFGPLQDEAARVIANLAFHLARRRDVAPERLEPLP